jgi:hypothetical protein
MAAALTTLVSFDGPDGSTPKGDLIADANGDLFGTISSAALTATGWCSKIANPGDIDLTLYNGEAFFNGRDTSGTLLAF